MPETTKACSKCKVIKPMSAFYRRGGGRQDHQHKCKLCIHNQVNEWKRDHPEQTSAWAKAWRAAHPEKVKQYQITSRAVADVNIKRWRDEHPRARYAHRRVQLALATGKLVKPETCSKCGSRSRLHAHHDRYDRPLEVVWACSVCHKAIHATD